MRSQRRLSICMGIRKSLNKWERQQDVAWLRISPGTIFEHDYWTRTKPRCEWCDDFTVAAVCDRRAFRRSQSTTTPRSL